MSTDATELAVYSAPARALHWLMAVLIVCGFTLGVIMVDLKISPTTLKLFAYHKWIGVTVFLLALLRIGIRLIAPPPPAPASLPHWQRLLSEAVHRLLYVLLFAIPLSGWLMSSAKGYQTVYLGVLPIPDLLAKNPPLGKEIEAVHEALNWLLFALVTVHAGAALKHQFIDRDNILRRMLPFLRAR